MENKDHPRYYLINYIDEGVLCSETYCAVNMRLALDDFAYMHKDHSYKVISIIKQEPALKLEGGMVEGSPDWFGESQR